MAVFLWTLSQGSTTDPAVLVAAGALEPGRVWDGEWWRLLTAAFVHVGPIHLGANMFFGVPWCRQLEAGVGTPRFGALYASAAVVGSAASLAGTAGLSAGASGALFGVIGATLALHRRMVGSWPAFFGNGATRGVLLNLGLLAVAGFWLPLDQWAHAGGFVAGAAMAWLWSRPRPRRWGVWVGYGAAVAAVVALALRPDPELQVRRDALAAVQAALRTQDPDALERAVGEARARGISEPWLTYGEGVLLAWRGEPEAALAKLEPLDVDDGPLRAQARAARARIQARLGVALVQGEGRPRDVAAGLALLDAACAAGEPDACEAAALVRRAGEQAPP